MNTALKQFFLNNRLYFIGAITGALAGYLYWYYIGCLSGTCAITSSPVNSTLYFGVMGALLFGFFRKEKKKKETVAEADAGRNNSDT